MTFPVQTIWCWSCLEDREELPQLGALPRIKTGRDLAVTFFNGTPLCQQHTQELHTAIRERHDVALEANYREAHPDTLILLGELKGGLPDVNSGRPAQVIHAPFASDD